MKKSKKLLAFLLSTFMICAVPAVISGCGDDDDKGNTDITQPEEKDAVKVKDGEKKTVEAGKTFQITISQYITANGKNAEVSSSNTAVVTVSESGGVVTVTGKAQGAANVIIKCGGVTVTFPVTVTASDVKTPAPVFNEIKASLDLREKDFVEVQLAPASGGEGFDIVYSVDLNDEAVINGAVLKLTPADVGDRSLTVTAKCTDGKNSETSYTVKFIVKISVTRSDEEKVYFKVTVDGVENKVEQGKTYTLPAYAGTVPEGKEFDGWTINGEKKAAGDAITVTADVTVTSAFKTKTYTVTIDGEAQTKEHGSTVTLPAYTGTVPEGKEFNGWTVNGEKKAAGDEITVTADLTITAEFKLKTYTVTIDGEAQTKSHGEKITLPAYTKTVEAGKEFKGWQVGNEVKTVGSEITVTGDLTITAVIENIPVTPPEEVKLTDTVALVLDTDDTEILNISDYIITNGHAVSVVSSAPETVAINSTTTQVTLTAKAFGSATVTIACGSITATITVNVSYPPSSLKETEVVDTTVHDLFAGELILNLAENINYNQQVTGYKVDGVAVEGSTFRVTGNFDQAATDVTLKITALFENADPLEYDYKVKVKDTTAYRAVNGGFASGNMTGWTFSDNENPIGGISDVGTFWEELPMFNDGYYFRGEANEGNTGTLTSPSFKVGGIKKISFKLGAGNGCFVTLEKEDGTVLAVWRNKKFNDIGGGWDKDKIGTEQFALNLVTYVADLSEWSGETVRLVINDEATGGIGFVTFDELVTYYESADDLPAGAETAVNELADISELTAKIAEAGAIVQGDYTAESFATLTAKISAASEIVNKKGVTAQQVANAVAEIEAAQDGLTLRVPEEKEVSKTLALKSGAQTTIDPSLYVDDKELSSITYELSTESGKLTVSGMVITAATVGEDSDETVTLTVKYKDEIKLTLSLTVKLTSGDKPVVKLTEVSKDIDIYTAEDKTKIKLNFAENIENPAELNLTYSVKIGDGTEDLTLDADNCYEYAFAGNYTDTPTEVVFNVVVGSTENTLTASYAYTLKIKDTTAYRLVNGDFEDEKEKHLYGWTLTNLDGSVFNVEGIDVVQNSNSYWSGKAAYNNTGYHFNGLDVIPEGSTFKLTSSPFTIGGSGYISFKLGGRAAVLKVCDSQTHELLAQYVNSAWADKGEPVGCIGNSNYQLTLIPYFADLSQYMGKEVYLVLEDRLTGGWGHSAMDEVKTYYTEAPTEDKFDTVTDLCGTDGHNSYNINWRKAVCPQAENEYTIANGGFETGDLTGWEVLSGNIYLLGGTSSEVYHDWAEHMPYNKSGEYFCKNAGVDEGAEWQLKSSIFTLAEDGNGCISFKMGSHNAIIKVYLADGTQIYEYTCKTYHADDVAFPHFEQGANYTTMLTHYADLSAYKGQKMYIVIGNNGEAGNFWKLAQFDDIVTYYASSEDLSIKQDQVPLTCTGKDVTHEDGATQAVNWIKAENEYNN